VAEVKTLKSKVCLVGEKAVGKTSLIRRYVLNMFDDKYITTMGTKVSKKEMTIHKPSMGVTLRVDMTIWDIMGEKGFRELLKDAYFYGANGILAVCDVTRKRTLEELDDWIDSVLKVVGRIPTLIAINKVDLSEQAQFAERDIEGLAEAFDCPYVYTSAKTGSNVEEAFLLLGDLVTDEQLKPR